MLHTLRPAMYMRSGPRASLTDRFLSPGPGGTARLPCGRLWFHGGLARGAAGGARVLTRAVVVLTRQTVTDPPTAAIAVISFALLLWKKIPEPVFAPSAASPESSRTDPCSGRLRLMALLPPR
jgi:hypothetical protein